MPLHTIADGGIGLQERGQEAKPLTDLQIAAQGYVFVLAGQDTTANGLSAVLYELAANPAIQRRLVEEVDAFPGGRLPEYDDIPQHFKYVEAAFQVLWLAVPSSQDREHTSGQSEATRHTHSSHHHTR